MKKTIHGLESDIFFCCQEITTLKGSNEKEAIELLNRAAKQVSVIMVKRKWKVLKLCEFYPQNQNLLGLNVNQGEKVLIRLRHAADYNRFLSYRSILGTLLHELCHNVYGPHDQKFYNLLNEIKLELSSIDHNFFAPQKLSNSTKPKNPTQAAAQAAIRRNQITQSSQRLGGGDNGLFKILSPSEMASAAAEQRLHDSIWCGCHDEEPISEQNNNNKKRKPPKTWSCNTCTYVNESENELCSMCSNKNKEEKWIGVELVCVACTLVNKKNQNKCELCGNALKEVIPIF